MIDFRPNPKFSLTRCASLFAIGAIVGSSLTGCALTLPSETRAVVVKAKEECAKADRENLWKVTVYDAAPFTGITVGQLEEIISGHIASEKKIKILTEPDFSEPSKAKKSGYFSIFKENGVVFKSGARYYFDSYPFIKENWVEGVCLDSADVLACFEKQTVKIFDRNTNRILLEVFVSISGGGSNPMQYFSDESTFRCSIPTGLLKSIQIK